MSSILKQIKSMYEQELYSNIIKISDLSLTVAQQKPDLFSTLKKFQITLYYADSLYHTAQHLQAENLYRQALQLRKFIVNESKNSNNKKILESANSVVNDAELKYKIHLCCMALKQKKAAADILQMILPKQRTPKINMALGMIYKDAGMERSAITCFKEVLRECPLALEAVENLLKLGTKGVEVNSLIIDTSSDINWVGMWIKAQAQLNSRDFTSAIQTYKRMDTHGLLKDNPYLLVNMAYCYHYLCDNNKSIALLQKAIRGNPNFAFGRDLLATLLANSNNKEHHQVLDTLTSNLDSTLWSSEYWVVLGNIMLVNKRYDRAAYFGQQACALEGGKSIEGLLLKANALFQLKKYQEAAAHCAEALQMCPFRYDLYKCLVECYLHSNRLREADTIALNACKELNYSAQAYCLHASCLLKDPGASVKNIRRVLEMAREQDKNRQTNAVYMLVDLLIREQQYDQAVQVLIKTLETQAATSKLHQLLGECYAHLQKDEEAFRHYTIALRLDPQNQRATDGLNSIGRSGGYSKREQYYSCADESCSSRRTNSDHEVDAESDTELWPGSVDMSNFDS